MRADRVRKSIGAENTFFDDLFSFDAAREALMPIIENVWRHCEATRIRGRTVTLKVKYADFHQITRRHADGIRTAQLRAARTNLSRPKGNPAARSHDVVARRRAGEA